MNSISPIALGTILLVTSTTPPRVDDNDNKPLVLKHTESGYLVYVETNREVLTVLSPEGKIIVSANIIPQLFSTGKNEQPAKIETIVDWTWKDLTKNSVPHDLQNKPLKKGFYVGIGMSATREVGLVDLKTGTYYCQGNL
jgi:hypothetical protein